MQDSLLLPRQIVITADPVKPIPKGSCVKRVGTASLEFQLDCFARHICRIEPKGARLDFFELAGKKKTPEFMEDLKQRVQREWIKMYGEPRKAGGANGDS